ncbi:MAG: DUF192 domain-containing protein [Alphaproteobacteria bacterium]|nr:DUF192 domain-containing protein [Alphaproteobacteria bacterium]
MPLSRTFLWAAACLALWGVLPLGAQAEEAFRRDTLSIVTGQGETYVFQIEVAETDRQRTQGLQYRKSLGPDAGMLFDFKTPQPVGMWMKNTYVPLDMLFIAPDGRILNIARDTTPLSLAGIASAGPAKAVLEVRAGTAVRLGLRAGDRVRHAIFE